MGIANAQEVRGSERWKGSKATRSECMRSMDGGLTWEPFTPAGKAETKAGRKRQTKASAAATYEARVSLLGVVSAD
jgi:hypothetical protein